MAVFTIGSSSVSGNNGGGDPPPSGGAVGGADNLTNNGAITQVSGAGVISESFVSQSGGTVTVEDTTAVTGDTRLVVKEGAGQDGPLQAWRTAGGDTVASLSNDAGAGTFKMSDGTNTGTFAPTYFQSVLSADGTTNVPFTFNASTLTIQDTTATTGDTKLVVKAGAGQAGNLQEWQDAAGTTIAAVDGYGQFGQSSNGGNTGVYVITGDGDYLRVVGETMSMFVNPTGLTTNSGGVPAAFSIDTTQLNITNTTATTGATLVNIVAGAAQTTKSVVLQTGGRIQAPLTTPTTSGETGTAGTIAWDANYIYICTSANTWKRVALAAF